ncbi:MAG TPA: phospholipase D-like domain-containing protein, partial [Candidatus Saccharimonadia bacterium]|nr:phospholipase D-like domain-containing protein [Candidatus Saccharimonadia bacterium]
AGVKVRLLVDAAGGASIGARTVWQLERSGVQVAWFRPGRFRHIHQLNHRTHRKILIVDGHIGFTGGVGIADEWSGAAQDKHHWRETHCRIDGPACVDLHSGFADNWREATRERLSPPEVTATPGEVSVLTTLSSSGKSRPTPMESLFTAIIATAKHRIWITSAYFVPSPSYVRELAAAAARGVDVRVLTTGRLSNHRVTQMAGRATYEQLLRAGVKIYEYEQTVLHSKIVTADKAFATFGSTNLDDRSLVLNDELNISFTDEKLVSALDLQFLQDLKNSRHIRSTHWYRRGWTSRAAEAYSSLFRGQL